MWLALTAFGLNAGSCQTVAAAASTVTVYAAASAVTLSDAECQLQRRRRGGGAVGGGPMQTATGMQQIPRAVRQGQSPPSIQSLLLGSWLR